MVLGDVLAAGIKSAAKQGKKALKNGLNGVDEAYRGLELHKSANIKTAAEKATAKARSFTESDLAEAIYAEVPDYARREAINRRRPGGPARANRATKRKAAHSVIYSEAQGMVEAYPDIAGEIESWVRGGYSYARDTTVGTTKAPMKDYPPFIGPDGRAWRLKSKGSFGAGYRLSAIDKGKLKSYGAKRLVKEEPWKNEDSMSQLLRALTKYGKAHKFAKLLKIMRSDFKAAMAKIPKGYSKGHLVSLDHGGIDVAENFVPQLLRNSRVKKDGKWVVELGNAAMQADSTTELAAGKGISSWDQYVRLKLRELD